MQDDAQEDVAYYANDFDFEEHRASVEAARAVSGAAATSSGAAAPTSWEGGDCGGDGTAAAWDAFHKAHAGAPFFKARRYLLKEFSQLAAQGAPLTVLEVGCGCGSAALPVLRSNPSARVVACDFAPAAAAAAAAAMAAAGVPSSRFAVFVADPSTMSPAAFASALDAACAAAGWVPPAGRVDAALAIFVMSAVPPPRFAHMVTSITCCIRPGGALLVRDYGLYDLPMLRFAPSAALAGDSSGRVFMRRDGTLARFFERHELRDAVLSAAAAEGSPLACDAAEWCCVIVRNRGEGLAMRRVFVHAAFTRQVE